MISATLDREVLAVTPVRIDRADLPGLKKPIGIFGSRSDLGRGDADDGDTARLMSCLHPYHREG